MTLEHRPGSPLAAGIVGLLMSAGYLIVWQVVVEQATCDETGMFACSGPPILMYVVGLPVTYVAWSIALRVARAPLPWLAPVAVPAALLVLVPMAEVVEPPAWVWPAVMGVLTGLWARFLRHDARHRPTRTASNS